MTPAIADSKLRPESVRYNESWLVTSFKNSLNMLYPIRKKHAVLLTNQEQN